jgi:hypothetical protein
VVGANQLNRRPHRFSRRTVVERLGHALAAIAIVAMAVIAPMM